MISMSVSERDNIGLHNVLSYVRGMLACSDNADTVASVTVCLANHTEAFTIFFDKQADGRITERYSIYKQDKQPS